MTRRTTRALDIRSVRFWLGALVHIAEDSPERR